MSQPSPAQTQPATPQPSEPTTVEKLQGLPWSMAGNATNIVFVKLTFFGSTFVLFLSALGLNKTQTGFLLSLMPYFGLVALFAAPLVSRFGLKRSFLTFWGLRQVATFAMVFTPWVLNRFGFQVMFVYITCIIIWFALCRALGETAALPWRQEYIPNNIRGKYSAKDSMITTLAGFGAVLVSGFVIGQAVGLNGYLLLFFVGGVFGLSGIWFYSHIPGGTPVEPDSSRPSVWQGMRESLKDGNFVRFLFGNGLIILAAAPIVSFVPLYMDETVGISAGNVILLQMGTLFGSLVSSYFWGWSSDRYGSKPAMMVSVFWRVLLPVVYLLTPRNAAISLPYAMFASMIQGVADIGWAISSARLLYVGVVPTEKKSQYMALHYAWVGLVGGTSQLLGGRLVDLSSQLDGQILGLTIDQYTPLFLLSMSAAALSIVFFNGVRADAQYGVGRFASMFMRGNPLLAVTALVRYQFAKNEDAAVRVTERLGSAKSPLAVDELLLALQDPRFNVRFEAIVAMARTKPDERVVDALIGTLNGTELALSSLSAWALGRQGDPRAIPVLHAAMENPHPSIRVQSIRALAALRDKASASTFHAKLLEEEDKGLQMAYASSLGKLGYTPATSDLLSLLYEFKNEGARMELALAIGRLLGQEHYFIQILREVREDPGTAMSRTVTSIKRELSAEGSAPSAMLNQLIDECAAYLAHGDVAGGAERMGQIVSALADQPDSPYTETARTILAECGLRLQEFGDEHIEYILLALHAMHAGLSRDEVVWVDEEE